MKRLRVLGIGIDQINLDEAVELALDVMDKRESKYVLTPNSEFLLCALENHRLRSAAGNAFLSLPDSAGVLLVARNLGLPLKEKVPGVDFAEALLEKMGQRGKSVFLLGAKKGIAEKAAERVSKKYPGIVIAQAEDNESYYADSPMVLLPSMQETDVTRSLLSAGEKILMVTIARGFHQPAVTPDGVMLSPVLMSGDAYVRHYRDGKDITHPQEGDETGRFPVALWADKMFDNGQVSHLFIQGDITMFLDIWMEANTSSTAYLLQIMRTLQGQEPVNLDIVPKTAQRESLTLGSLTPAVIVTVMLPLLVLLGAALVLWPRRNL